MLPIAVIAIATIGLAAPSRVGATVSPATATITIPAGGSAVEVKTVGVPTLPPKADILIAIDTTGSMGASIDQAQADANAIVTGVKASVSNSQFAVVQFRDFGDSPEYAVVRSMTSDASLVSAAINGLTPGGGGDFPEAHNLVFKNSYTPETGGPIGWRAGTKKIVVVISDASPHGAGTAGLAGCTDTTADPNGLNTATELAAMAAANRTLFMVHQASTTSTSLACYESIAAVTSGDAVDVGTALGSQIVTLINAAFNAATDVHMEVASAPPSASAAWISFNPTSRPNIATPGSTTFDVQIAVPIGTPAGSYVFDLVALADGADIGHQTLTVVVPPPFSTPSLMRAVSVTGSSAFVIGRVDGADGQTLTLAAFTAASCTDGALAGAGTAAGAPVTAMTDANGYFGATFTGVSAGAYLAVEVTAPAETDRSSCIVSSGDNDHWPKALNLGTSLTASDYIDAEGKARWYKFPIKPGQRIDVSLTGLGADYDLAVFKDIEAEFLQQLTPEDADDLTKLSAEYAPSVFSPSVFSPSVFSPSVFSPDAYAPSVFSPSVFSPSVFSPSVFSPSVFSPSVFSPSVFSPSVFSPSVFSPSVFSPSVFSPSVFSPSVFSPDELARAFSSAQTRTIIGVSATPGTGDETSVVNTWNNTGFFYVRVGGHAGAFSTESQFTINVAKGPTTCGAVSEPAPFERPASTTTGKSTIILTDSSKVALDAALPGGGTLRAKLTALAARGEVAGVLVDVATDARVTALKTQAASNAACPYAMNLVAEEIKTIVDSYRTPGNPDLRYVVIAGGDTAIPFFRYPDQSLLGQESAYVPPVKSDSVSEASLRRDFVLSQDAYGSAVDISLRTSDFPVPGLAVGRLIETPSEIAGMLDAYTDTSGVVAPKKSLVTGYDFLEDAANAVNGQLVAGTGTGTGTVHDTLITPNETSPQDPASWTAAQLKTKLLGSRHDIMFLAGHFSANSALAADFQTSLITTDLATAPADHFKNAIVFSAGCHAGYNLLDDEALPGVALPLDWSQAFAQEQATLIAGTGYQYGDTDFIEYSERLYLDLARELRAGTGPVAIGEALTRAKLTYLATTPDIRGIHEKALLEATLYGLPMLGVDMIKDSTSGPGPAINPVEQPAVNGTDLGLAIHDLSNLSPALGAEQTLVLKNLSGGADIPAKWLAGPNGVVSNPAEPALPLAVVNATSNNGNQVLRGVGFRGGTYTDSGPIVPLTGAPTTELRGVHVPFTSPVFYPMRLWTPNYFGALSGTGGTSLLVTPAQHKADPLNPGKSIRRTFDDLDLRLFYSSNITAAALSDAPSIVGVDAQPNGPSIDFTIQVVGDPNAFIHSVWITHTNGGGTWAPLDLAQSSVDTSLWTGSLASAANLKFVVQAANGLGLVSFDDNRGSYYSAAGGTLADTTLTLLSAPSSGAFGDSPVVTAELMSGSTPLSGKTVTISIGGSSAIGTTGSNGRFSPSIPLNSTPGTTQITASFGGDAAYGPSSDRHAPFTISKATASLSPFTSQFSAVTAGGRSGITTDLSATVGGSTQFLGSETVTFTLTGAASRTYSTITDYLGRATLPTTGLAAGTYTVAASFAGNATYTNASRGSGTLVLSAFTGFFSPVDNLPTLNTVSAGSTIPVKFSLGGNRGLVIFATDYPKAVKITCQTGAPVDAIEETSTSNSGLVYDASSNRYQYNWKTLKTYAGSCYRLDLKLTDGSTYSANFKFK